jgi:hypothetical protein
VIPGHIEEAAKAVRDGLPSVGVEAECKRIQDTKPAGLERAFGIFTGLVLITFAAILYAARLIFYD